MLPDDEKPTGVASPDGASEPVTAAGGAKGALSPEELARVGDALLRDLPDAVIFADGDGVVRYWNAGAVRIFGFEADEALGQSLDLIIPERLRQRHWDGYRQTMATGKSTHAADEVLSVPATTKSGATLSIQFTVAPVAAADGGIAGIVAVLRDATPTFAELKRLRAAARSRT